MALQQQNVPVQFRGLETKLDPRQAVIGDVLLLENVRFDAPPKFQKRFGYDRIGKALAGTVLSTFKDQLLIGDGANLFPLGAEAAATSTAPGMLNANVETFSIFKDDYVSRPVDHALHSNGIGIFGFRTRSSDSFGAAVIDTATGRVLYSSAGGSTTARRCLCVGNKLILFYVDDVNHRIYTASCDAVTAPGTVTTLGSFTTNLVAGSPVDGTVVNGVGYVVYVTSAGIVMRSIDSALTVSGETTLVAGVSPTALTVFGSSTTHLWLGYATASGVFAARFTTAGTQTLAPTSISATTSGVALIAGIDGYGGVANFFWEVRNSTDTWKTKVMTRGCHSASGPGAYTEQTFGRGVGLASRPCLVAAATGAQPEDTIHVLTLYPSKLQGTYFLRSYRASSNTTNGNGGPPAEGSSSITSKAAAGLAGDLNSTVPSLLLAGGKASVMIARATRLAVAGGVTYVQTGVDLASFDFAAKIYSQEMGSTTLFSGGFARAWDGVAAAEHGFHLYPEHVTVTGSSSVPPAGPVLATAGAVVGGYYTPQTRYYRLAAIFADGTESYASNEVSVTYALPNQNAVFTWGAVTSAVNYRLYAGPAPDTYDLCILPGNVLTFNDVGWAPYWSLVPENRPIIGGVSDAATYQVCAVYEWTDAQGVLYQSAPSPPVEVQAPRDTPLFDYVVETLRSTTKSASGTIAIYRTAGNQSVFFRVTPIPQVGGSPLYNSAIVDTVTFSEAAGAATLDETYLKGCQQLVFNPLNSLAEVPPLPADPPKFLTRYRNRIVTISSEAPGQVCFSKVVNPGVPIEFNPQQFYLTVQGGAANLVGAIEMDDKLILFAEDRIYYTAGDGPAPNGTGNDYANPYRVPSDVGCVNPRSLVLTPMGVLFQSFKGIYLLGRDLSVQYFGAPVEAFGTTPITSANTLPDCQRIVLTLNSGVALVYDSFVQKWTVWTNYNAADALVYGGKFTHLRPDGSINRENTSRFTDQEAATNAAVLIKFTTTQLSFAGLNGFQRAWRFMIRGDYKSPHSLKVDVTFDEDSTKTQSITFDTAAYFGVATVKPYEFQVKLKYQKCSTLQVTITETEPSGQEGEGLALSGLTFIAGLLPGLHKVPVGRTIS